MTAPKVGYHGTPRTALASVLGEGLRRDRTSPHACRHGGHISIAETPEIAACFVRDDGAVLVVDLDGLNGLSEFYGGEARVHGDIAPERLSVYDGEVVPSLSGHIDPMKTPLHQHPACADPSKLEQFNMEDYKEGPINWDEV